MQKVVNTEKKRIPAETESPFPETNGSPVTGSVPVSDAANISAIAPSVAKIVANEPSRLESLLLAKQIETYCAAVEGFCGN